eukprot:364079-Chlamydomonas_euryale.AAC.4
MSNVCTGRPNKPHWPSAAELTEMGNARREMGHGNFSGGGYKNVCGSCLPAHCGEENGIRFPHGNGRPVSTWKRPFPPHILKRQPPPPIFVNPNPQWACQGVLGSKGLPHTDGLMCRSSHAQSPPSVYVCNSLLHSLYMYNSLPQCACAIASCGQHLLTRSLLGNGIPYRQIILPEELQMSAKLSSIAAAAALPPAFSHVLSSVRCEGGGSHARARTALRKVPTACQVWKVPHFIHLQARTFTAAACAHVIECCVDNAPVATSTGRRPGTAARAHRCCTSESIYTCVHFSAQIRPAMGNKRRKVEIEAVTLAAALAGGGTDATAAAAAAANSLPFACYFPTGAPSGNGDGDMNFAVYARAAGRGGANPQVLVGSRVSKRSPDDLLPVVSTLIPMVAFGIQTP